MHTGTFNNNLSAYEYGQTSGCVHILDPNLLATILKESKETLLPVPTKIVNLSLQTATMPTHLKKDYLGS